MKKLKLSLEQLDVESFRTTDVQKRAGTVVGNDDDSLGTTDYGRTCDSTCFQRICTCTLGFDTACDYTCGSCPDFCDTQAGCPSRAGYPGC